MGYAGIPNPAIGALGDVPYNYGPSPNAAMADGYDRVRALSVADYSELSLRLSLAGGIVPSEQYRGDDLRTQFATQHQLALEKWDFRPVAGTDVASRRATYHNARTNAFMDARYDTGSNEYNLVGGFGVNDLSELVTRWAINDYSITSNLERALSGRDNEVPIAANTPGTPRYDPLRSTRPERDFDGAPIESSQAGLGRYTAISNDPTSDFGKTMLFFASDIRHRVTPLSGARSFRNMRGVSPDVISESEVRLDATGLGAGGYYAGYADALLPFSGLTDAWEPTPSSLQTQFYGHQGPQLAMYIAAHMAVNMTDMKDGDSLPSACTLLLNETYREMLDNEDGVPAYDRVFPWWQDNGQLSLLSSRLAPNAADTLVPAVNVYGIEAQPFITQVASFTVYTDTPPGAGGDDEMAGTPPPDPLITIDDTIDTANEDFLYRVVAFQLTNPFNKAVTLSGDPFDRASKCDIGESNYPPVDIERSFFYITLGDKNGASPVKHYKLASLVEQVYLDPAAAANAAAAGEPGANLGNPDLGGEGYIVPPEAGGVDITLEPITIDANSTIVCYTVSQTPRTILETRYLSAIDPSMDQPDLVYPAAMAKQLRKTIREMIERGIGSSSSDISGVYWVPEIDPTATTTGRNFVHPDPDNLDKVDPIITGPLQGNVVQLWRAMRTGDKIGEENYTDENQPPLDRPSTYWDGTTPQQPFEEDTEYLPRNYYGNDQLVDRFRVPSSVNLDVRLHATGGNEGIAGTETDVQDSTLNYTIAAWAMARRPADPRPGSMAPPKGAIPAYCIEAKYSLTDWNFGSTAWPSALDEGVFVSGFDKGADKTAQSWRMNFIIASLEPAESVAEATTHVIDTMPNQLGTINYQDYYPEVALADNNFRPGEFSTMRLADLLLPLGIGPVEAPKDASDVLITDSNIRYTTLSEALAVALGYEQPATLPGDVTQLYMPVAVGAQPIKSPLDRGNLRLDDYVPFYDDDTDGVFTPGSDDERRGLSIPLALNVLDIFSAKPAGPESRTRAAPGLININTMSTMVARQLPLLSPAPDMDAMGMNWWWWEAPGASSAYAPLARMTPVVDIAASVISYRDKVNTSVKPVTMTDPVMSNNNVFPTGDVWFSDVDPTTGAIVAPDQTDMLYGRSYWSGIAGLNENAGFRTIGELANVRFRNPNPNDPMAAAWMSLPVNMDYMAFDVEASTLLPLNNGREGVDSVLYDVSGAASESDELGNEYKEKLAVLNAVSNSVTTRSDYFAVWFVVHGYQKSDVENMKDEDPLVPSIARRFVMVVDRSNVVRKGDKPRIVLFKEVPL